MTVCGQVDGATPLLVAVEAGHEAVITELLASGASVDQAREVTVVERSSGGGGCVQVVCRSDYAFVCLSLAVVQFDGTTPVMMAIQKGMVAAVGAMLPRCANLNGARKVNGVGGWGRE